MSFGDDKLFDVFDEHEDSNKNVPFREQNNEDETYDTTEEGFEDQEKSALLKMKSDLHKMKKENRELRRTLRLFTQQPDLKIKSICQDGPVAQLVLFNASCTDELAEELKSTVMNVIDRHTELEKNDYLHKVQPSGVQYPSKQYSDLSHKEEKKLSKAYMTTQVLQFFRGNFYMDQIGQRNPDSENGPRDYELAALDPLNGVIEELDLNAKPTKIKRTCWNCDSDAHEIKDCPEDRNPKNIQKARVKFMNQQTNSPKQQQRAFRPEAEDPRNDKYTPGVIGKELREALGISSTELPPYIMQMRDYGYPPGHYYDAYKSSRLVIHDSNVKKNEEEEEVQLEMDVEKLIDYPGFNTEFTDLYSGHHLQPIESLRDLINYHNHKNQIIKDNAESLLRKKKIEEHTESINSVQVVNLVDMDCSNDEEPNVLNEVPKVSDSGRATQMLQSDPATQKQEDPEKTKATAKDVDFRYKVEQMEGEETIVLLSSSEDGEICEADAVPKPSTTNCSEKTPPVKKENTTATNSAAGGVPHRSNFAEGCTPFVPEENTVSKGTYKKLQNILQMK